MDDHDAGPAQALGPGGAHVVGGEVLGHLGTGQAQHVGEGDGAQHHGRHEELGEAGALTGGDRQPSQADPDDELQDEADDEGGHGDDHQGEHQDGGVEPAALPHPGDEAEADARNGLKGQGHEGELDGDRIGPHQHVEDGLGPPQRLAQVQGEQSLEVEQVLDDEGLVEVVARLDLVNHLGAERALAPERGDRVARQGEDHGVDEQRGTEEHRDHLQQPACDVTKHVHFLPIRTWRWPRPAPTGAWPRPGRR